MPKRKGILIRSSEDWREDLECPVCLVIPKNGPIYQCESGHIHCNTCHPGLRECPICRGPIGNTRCLSLEKIIARLPAKCNFNEHGCMEDEKLPEQILRHEKVCNFRLVKCLQSGCNDKIPLSDFLDHYKVKHDYKPGGANSKWIYSTSNNSLTFSRMRQHFLNGTGWNSVTSFVKSRKHMFVTYHRQDEQKGLLFFACILGSQLDIDNEKYECRMEVFNPKSVGFHLF